MPVVQRYLPDHMAQTAGLLIQQAGPTPEPFLDLGSPQKLAAFYVMQ